MAAIVASTIALREAQSNQIAWRLLRSKNAAAIIAILDKHLGGSERRMPVAEFASQVEMDLEDLRVRAGFDMTQSAERYCEDWRKSGYLIRKPHSQMRQETYELSSGAFSAINFAKALIKPHRATTQSRLSTVVNQINSLALEMDGNEERRLKTLTDERDAIDRQIEDMMEGRYTSISEDEALERARDILDLVREIPGDFVRVRDDFERISRTLHETILNSEDGHAQILEDIFSGYDAIAQSPSGQSFSGFYALLRDSDLSETVQDNINAILESKNMEDLAFDERQRLRSLLRDFLKQSQEVNDVRTSLSHGLNRFVQSREFMSDRELKRLLDLALGKAHRVAMAHALGMGCLYDLSLTAIPLGSISRIRLHNPATTQADVIEPIEHVDVAEMSIAELLAIARLTEIDFQELRGNVASTLQKTRERSGVASASIAQVLGEFPATQGIASVVGLMVLAYESGREDSGKETIEWTDANGTVRRALIPKLVFEGEV